MVRKRHCVVPHKHENIVKAESIMNEKGYSFLFLAIPFFVCVRTRTPKKKERQKKKYGVHSFSKLARYNKKTRVFFFILREGFCERKELATTVNRIRYAEYNPSVKLKPRGMRVLFLPVVPIFFLFTHSPYTFCLFRSNL